MEAANSNQGETKGLAHMLLPCRTCRLNNGNVEVRNKLETFTTATTFKDLWDEVAKCQDLERMRCRGRLRGGIEAKPANDIDQTLHSILKISNATARNQMVSCSAKPALVDDDQG